MEIKSDLKIVKTDTNIFYLTIIGRTLQALLSSLWQKFKEKKLIYVVQTKKLIYLYFLTLLRKLNN